MTETHGAPLELHQLPALLSRVHSALEARREEIDELNVFPVPDGDTGTNMTLTARAALEALERTDDPLERARAAVRGALQGARGNSGVILSQVLRAVAEAADEARDGPVDGPSYARALTRARVLAYEAVAAPVEGTILTVVAEAARVATETTARAHDLVEVSARSCAAASRAVAATTDQLDVLRDAGVVDAGARGFEVMLGAVHAHLTGEPAPRLSDVTPRWRPHRETREQELSHRYEVQYLLDASDNDVEGLQRRLEVLGDSVVVVAAGDLINVHVHTDDVGAAIEAGLEVGRPSEIEVTHVGDQISSRRRARAAVVGALAVLDGDGAHALATEQGATVVAGHAGALPSVADLLNAAGDVRTERVVVLPGHPDAVAAAHQARQVAVAEGGRPFEVVDEADSPGAVLAALSMLVPEGPVEVVLTDMRQAAAALRSGEVVAAVRDADTPVGPVRQGQPLVVVDGEVAAVLDDPLAALAAVCEQLGTREAERTTLLLGATAPDEERARAEQVARARADGEVEVIDTGHRPSRYAVGVE